MNPWGGGEDETSSYPRHQPAPHTHNSITSEIEGNHLRVLCTSPTPVAPAPCQERTSGDVTKIKLRIGKPLASLAEEDLLNPNPCAN